MLEDLLWLCPSLLTCLLLSAVSVAAIVFLKGRLRDQSTLPPGPRGWEALCSVLKAMREENLHIQAEKWSGQYGELVLCRAGLVDVCFLNSVRVARECFAGRQQQAVTNNRRRAFTGWFLFNNYSDLASSDGRSAEWDKMRKLFHRSVKFYGDGVDRIEILLHTELQRLVTELEAMAHEDVCLTESISDSIARVIGQMITGEQPDHRLVQLIMGLSDCINAMFNPSTDVLLGLFPWLRFLPLTSFKSLCDKTARIKTELYTRVITEAKKTRVPGKPRGLADSLLDEQEKSENGWLSDDNIKGIIGDTVGAGVVTSLQTLKACFLYLTHHRDMQQRIQAEIEKTFGDRQPCLGKRSDLPLAEAVTMETLRYSTPVALGLPHEASDDVTVSGYTIPKGSVIFSNAWVFHHDPEMFPDPDCFRPTRFLDDEGQLLSSTHPTRLRQLSFGVGPRSCPGKTFARSRVFLYVTTLLQTFDFLPPSDHPLLPTSRDSWNNGLSLDLKPYHVTLRKRLPVSQ